MKFYCDACHTKYAISDDKVRGKVLRIRCKKCANIITVREHRAPATEANTPPSSPPPASVGAAEQAPTTHWYYALNGETFGPFTLTVLREKYATAALSDATYVWHDTFDSWKPVAVVPAFAGALTQGQKIRPRMQTLGFSGELQAVKVEAGPSKDRAGAVPAAARPSEPKPDVRTVEAERPQPTPQPQATPGPQTSTKSQPPKSVPTSEWAPSREPAVDARSEATPQPAHAQPVSRKGTATSPPGQATPPARPAGRITQPPPRPDIPRPRALSSPGAAVPTPEARPLQEARKDKLDRLRERLTFDSLEPTPAISADAGPDSGAESEPEIDHAGPTTVDPGEVSVLPQPVAGGAMLTFAPGVTKSGDSGLHEPSDDVVNFELPPRAGSSAAKAKPSPSSTSDILDGFMDEPSNASAHVDNPTDSGIVPIFPAAAGSKPRIDPALLPAVANTSESVLIEMKSLQKEGRGKRGLLIGGAVAAVVLIIGAGITAAVLAPPDEPKATTPTVGPPTEHRDELVQRTYSKNDIDKFQTMQLEDGLLFDEDEVAADQEGASAADQVGEKPEAPVEKPEKETRPQPQEKPSKAVVVRTERKSESVKHEESKPASASGAKEEGGDEAPDRKPTEAELVNSLLQPRKERAVVRPEDKLAAKSTKTSGLSKEQAVVGFRDIKGSVRTCRDSHNRRSAPLNVGKIKVTVTVQPQGNVSGFEIHSDKVKHTEFDRCMESRRKRWKFPQFSGDPVVIQTSIIL